MGLDQYAYVAARAGQQDEFYKTSKYIEDTDEWVSETAKPREIAYWRKRNDKGKMRIECYAGQLLEIAKEKAAAMSAQLGEKQNEYV